MWQKVGKMESLTFRPEITYGMLRIMILVLASRVFEKITKNRRQPVKPKNHRNEVKFHDQTIDLG